MVQDFSVLGRPPCIVEKTASLAWVLDHSAFLWPLLKTSSGYMLFQVYLGLSTLPERLFLESMALFWNVRPLEDSLGPMEVPGSAIEGEAGRLAKVIFVALCFCADDLDVYEHHVLCRLSRPVCVVGFCLSSVWQASRPGSKVWTVNEWQYLGKSVRAWWLFRDLCFSLLFF